MRVCMLAYSFYENDGRIKRYAETLVKKGFKVDVVSLKRNKCEKNEKIKGVNVIKIHTRSNKKINKYYYTISLIAFFLKSSFFFFKSQFGKPYDFIHVHNVPDFLVFTTVIPRLNGAKIVLDIHDIVPEFYCSKFDSGKSSLMYKVLLYVEKLSARYSDHVIVSNHLWEKTLTQRSIEFDKCTTLINYPDLSIFKYKKREEIKYNKNNRFILIYPGTFNWHQGVDIAIKSMSIIKDKNNYIDLHLYGGGPLLEPLKSLVNSLGLEERVIFKEGLPLEQIAERIACADLGVVPKRAEGFGGEAFSTKIMEFMSVGVPVVGSRTPIDQYYFNSDQIMFFEPEDEKDLAKCILEISTNKALKQNLIENSLKFIEENNWEKQSKIYMKILNKIGLLEHSIA